MSASGRSLQQSNVAETIIGAVVILVAVAFLFFTYSRTGSGSLSGYDIQARLAKVDGLGVGTDVRISGIKVGSVSDLTLDPKTYLVTVHMHIRDDIKIPTDSSLVVTSSGILGSSYISITPGGDDTMLAVNGMITNSQGAVDVMGLVNRFVNNGGQGSNPAPAPKPATPPAATPSPMP